MLPIGPGPGPVCSWIVFFIMQICERWVTISIAICVLAVLGALLAVWTGSFMVAAVMVVAATMNWVYCFKLLARNRSQQLKA